MELMQLKAARHTSYYGYQSISPEVRFHELAPFDESLTQLDSFCCGVRQIRNKSK